MIFWLNAMTHPDGNISFFNDAAFGIAVPSSELNSYATKLGHKISSIPEGLTYLEESGYVRVTKGGFTLLIDVAPVGPDYIPAHAHADTLSYEFSSKKQRVVVNWTSHYYPGSARDFQRGTSAHSTVEVDSMNSTEVWHSFRVARQLEFMMFHSMKIILALLFQLNMTDTLDSKNNAFIKGHG